ncbi:PAS domain-containing sensor histidine kinase [Sunxiuqinia sp. A32]|uniref:PAS domain-containing sensor histidine kinase n=1 Tax=Sunxiuqinia sp. A32 TaxID=3461496 RepID=UPI004046365D
MSNEFGKDQPMNTNPKGWETIHSTSQKKYKYLYKMMRLMCDNVPDLIWSKDLNRCYTFANKELCRSILLTNDIEEPIGKTSAYFYNRIKNEKPDDKEWYTLGDLSDHSDDFVYQFHKPIQVVISGFIRGKFVEIELTKAPFIGEDGSFIGLVGAGRDVTKRKVIEKNLRLSEERLQLAMDGANLGIWDWQISTGKLLVDRKWVSYFGYTSEEFNNDLDFFKNLIHEDDIDTYEQKMNAHFMNETPRFECTFRLLHKDANQYYWLKSVGTIIERNSQEEPIRMVGVHQDVTESVEYENKLKQAMLHAEESERLKTAFLANLSHEIRTPLNSILGFTKFLVFEEDLPMEIRKEYMEIVEESSENFLQIINNIIDMSKIESGVFTINKAMFDLHELCEEVLENLNKQYRYSDKVTLSFSPDPENELMIYTDNGVLEHILTSLLSNAIKFTHEGEVELGYELVDEHRLFIYVKDSGIGINPKYEKVIFQPFRQLSESFKREYGGAGLGLAIAFSMTEILNGKLWFESEEGRGTIFYVFIPLD